MSPFDRLLKTMLQPWIAACYLGFTALSFFYFDKPVAYFFKHLELGKKMPVFNWATHLGVNFIYIVTFFILFLFFRYVRRNKLAEIRSLFLWLCVLVPSLICSVFKVFLGRARPELLFENQLYGFYGMHFKHEFWSFPSGHTTTIMGLVFGLCIVFPRYMYGFLLTGVLLISTRVLLTNHFLSDVMVTSFLTLLEIGFMLNILRRKTWLVSAYKPILSAV